MGATKMGIFYATIHAYEAGTIFLRTDSDYCFTRLLEYIESPDPL